jgi:hypothetical protein
MLELLPSGEGPLQDTISMYALGPYGGILRVALLCLGVGSYGVAAKFWRSVGGRCGWLLGALTCVWATGSILDSCINPSPTGKRTWHGEIHVQIAVAAFAALVVAATVFALWLRVQQGRRFRSGLVPTLWVFGAAAAEIVVSGDRLIAWGGLAERMVFISSVAWMFAAMKLIGPVDAPDGVRSVTPANAGCRWRQRGR